MAPGVHIPLRFVRAALKKGIGLLKTRFAAPSQTGKLLEPIYARIPTKNATLHSSLRQKIAGRWYSTTARLIGPAGRYAAPRVATANTSAVRSAIGRSTAYSPFASTLRPKLVGGTFPRTAGGYSIGGGARYFSHSPAAPAQVISQVSSAMRAFMLSGKGQMDSYRRHDGKAGRIGVRAQLASSLAQDNAPGAYVDFDLSPTFTALSPLGRPGKASLENGEFIQGLAADFGCMIGGLAAVYSDIRRLSTLGDLPVTLVGANGDILRVHFRGCDRDFVELLCDEVGVRRGIVHEDERFAFSILAPGETPSWRDMMSDSPPLSSMYSEDGHDDDLSSDDDVDMLASRISGSDEAVGESYYFDLIASDAVHVDSAGSYDSSSLEHSFEGLEGVHRFLEECDEYRNGLNAWRSV